MLEFRRIKKKKKNFHVNVFFNLNINVFFPSLHSPQFEYSIRKINVRSKSDSRRMSKSTFLFPSSKCVQIPITDLIQQFTKFNDVILKGATIEPPILSFTKNKTINAHDLYTSRS